MRFVQRNDRNLCVVRDRLAMALMKQPFKKRIFAGDHRQPVNIVLTDESLNGEVDICIVNHMEMWAGGRENILCLFVNNR